MKRSEMLKVITDELFYGSLAARVDKSNTTVTELAEKDAEAVLKLIEKFGMLPPMSDETMSSNPFHVADSILESVAHDFKWEPEDDLP